MGAAATRWLILPRSRSGECGSPEGAEGSGDERPPTAPSGTPDPLLSAACASVGRTAALATLPALLLLFLAQIVRFRDPFVPWTEDAKLLVTGTDWGTVWLASLALAVVAAGAFHRAARRTADGGGRMAWAVATAASLGLAATPALSGHAVAVTGPTALAVTADALHVVAAGVWLGGLAVVLRIERSARRSWPGSGARSPLPALVTAFSPVALVAVPVLVITGSTGAWLHLPDWGSLLDSPYGRRLSLKIGVALGVFALGAVNWRRHRPALLAEAARGAGTAEGGGAPADARAREDAGVPESPGTCEGVGTPEGAGARERTGARESGREAASHRRLRRTAALELAVGQVVLLLTAWLLRASPPME